MSVADELKKLNELKEAGILTDEEYATQKALLLGGAPSSGGAAEAALQPPTQTARIPKAPSFATTDADRTTPADRRPWRQVRGTGIYSFLIVLAWLWGVVGGIGGGIYALEGDPVVGLIILASSAIGAAIQIKILGDLKWLIDRA